MDPEVDENEAEIARVKLSALKFDRQGHRELSAQIVARLHKIFAIEGCLRLDNENFISAVITSDAFRNAIAESNLESHPSASKTTARFHSSALRASIAFMGYIAWPPREATSMKTINGGRSDSTLMVRYKISIIIRHLEAFRFVRGRVSKAYRGIREHATLFGWRDLLENPFL